MRYIALYTVIGLAAACGSKKKDKAETPTETTQTPVAAQPATVTATTSTNASTATDTSEDDAEDDAVASLLNSLAPSLTLSSPVGQQDTGANLRLADDEEGGEDLDSEDPKKAREAMAAIFDAAVDVKGCLIGSKRTRMQRSDIDCYGPAVATKNHPDASAGATGTQLNPDLPGGDLGIVDAHESHDDGDEACVAAKTNQLLGQVRNKVSEGIEGAKRALCFARVLGLEVPDEVGEELDMTDAVNAALADEAIDFLEYGSLVLTLLEEDIYQTEISVTVPRGELWTRLVSDRRVEGTTSGYLWGVFTQTDEAAALAGPIQSDPDVFSILFQDDGTSLVYDATKSRAQSDDDQAALEDDKAALFEADKRVRVAESGNPGYDHVIANLDVESGVGEMIYLWTAGSQMEEQRTLHAKTELDDAGDKIGWGYFGFGKALGDFRELVETGDAEGTASIEKMVCNWAGPNNSHAGVTYAQKQVLTLDTDTGYFIASDSDIGFAAQNTCGQTGYSSTYTFARREGNTTPADSEFAAWPTFDLISIAEGTDDAANLVIPALLSIDF
jgi:hypothetical protein